MHIIKKSTNPDFFVFSLCQVIVTRSTLNFALHIFFQKSQIHTVRLALNSFTPPPLPCVFAGYLHVFPEILVKVFLFCPNVRLIYFKHSLRMDKYEQRMFILSATGATGR